MIVDNMFMTGRGTCTVNTADCDQFTPGNQGFLPVTILTKGAIVFEPNTALNVAGNGETGGPGGGGGGGLSDDGVFNSNTGLGTVTSGGNGYTGGEGGFGMPGGEGTGGNPIFSDDSTAGGLSLNGMGGATEKPGADDEGAQGTGGGSGYPFGTSGEGGYTASDETWNTIGGYSGGSGADESHDNGIGFGGSGGGNATPGTTTTSGGGFVSGNETLVPLAGGSGGGGANPYGGSAGYGGGGGGAIALYGKTAVYIWSLIANGAGGGNNVLQNPGTYTGGGGGGSGGGVIIGSKLSFSVDTVSAKGGNGGTSISFSPIDSAYQRGGNGGAGRVRFNGPLSGPPIVIPGNASLYHNASTDTSEYVARYVLPEPAKVSDRHIPEAGIGRMAIVRQPSRAQGAKLDDPNQSARHRQVSHSLAAAQHIPNPDTGQYTIEPQEVLSQAAANILYAPPVTPHIAAQKIFSFGVQTCNAVTVQPRRFITQAWTRWSLPACNSRSPKRQR